MMINEDDIYRRLHRIYSKYRSKYRGNPDSKQIACMWSTYRPPDTLCDTRQIAEIENEFDIELNEDEAMELYDMYLDEAAKRINEIQAGQSTDPFIGRLKKERSMAKAKSKKDKEREERISMEIIVDANGPDEQAMGWYYYLEDQLRFPFTAHCTEKRAISPLRLKDEIVVFGMAPEDECAHEMFVTIQWEKDGLAVPLSQITPIDSTDAQTRQAVGDWHYWMRMGYEFAV